eukprot:549756-Amphidinium_carterae.1
MISHRWRRPDYPHPDDEKNHKAKALAKYGEAALVRNVEMYFWLDFAGVNQDNGNKIAQAAGSESQTHNHEVKVLDACWFVSWGFRRSYQDLCLRSACLHEQKQQGRQYIRNKCCALVHSNRS